MNPKQTAPTTIDAYIAGFPPDVQKILRKIRLTIRKAAPQAGEAIKYQMPTFTLNGNLVSFGVYKQHIGIYPVPAGTQKFQQEIAPYRSAKSTLRLPLDEPIPFDLISQFVRFRVKESPGGFLAMLSAPARRALEREGITTLKQARALQREGHSGASRDGTRLAAQTACGPQSRRANFQQAINADLPPTQIVFTKG